MSPTSATPDPGSFREREGRVYHEDGRIFRGLSTAALADFHQLQNTRFYKQFVEAGRIVDTCEVPAESLHLPREVSEQWSGFLEHQRIPAITYPYEWTFGMLREAAELQLDLLAAAIPEGMTLKDASPYNIQFHRGQAVFIDIPSFEKLEPGSTWTGYRQFCEMFLFPLLLQSYKDIDFQPFLRSSINGIDVQTAARLFSLRDRFRSGVMSHVWLQSVLDRRYGSTRSNVKSNLKSAGFNREMILSNVRRLKKLVTGLTWKGAGSEWGGYAEFHNYSEADHQLKEQFIDRCLAEIKPSVAWDVGCNTGQFANIAARHAGLVIAMDMDHLAVDKLYNQLGKVASDNLIPLMQNVADPSPSWGWRNRERTDLVQRVPPDLLMCLALIHHVVISANIPLTEFIGWLASLSRHLIIEFVSRDDGKVQALLRNKKDHYVDYSQSSLEAALNQYFVINDRLPLESGNRQLYWCQRR